MSTIDDLKRAASDPSRPEHSRKASMGVLSRLPEYRLEMRQRALAEYDRATAEALARYRAECSRAVEEYRAEKARWK